MGNALGELIRELREKRGWTQQQLADSFGVGPDRRPVVPVASLRNWEQGHRWPDLGTAYKLAKALGVPLDRLGAVAAAGQKRKKPEKTLPADPHPYGDPDEFLANMAPTRRKRADK